MKDGEMMAVVPWVANPFRGDRFEELWLPAAAAALRYGASEWSFYRSLDDPLSFHQTAVFETKLGWERYWYSEEISEARASASGLFQVPLLPLFWRVTGTGHLAADSATASPATGF
jgi:hypothetical protein